MKLCRLSPTFTKIPLKLTTSASRELIVIYVAIEYVMCRYRNISLIDNYGLFVYGSLNTF